MCLCVYICVYIFRICLAKFVLVIIMLHFNKAVCEGIGNALR